MLAGRSRRMGVGIPSGDVVPPQAAKRVLEPIRKLDACSFDGLAEAWKVVPPRSSSQPMQQGLESELGGLFGREARPVVKFRIGLDPGSAQGAVGLVAPAAKLFLVERRSASHAAIMSAGALRGALQSGLDRSVEATRPGRPYPRWVPLPGWLARLNRRVTNPALRPLAGRLPAFGIVLHRGRRTGRVYRTPVNAFPHEDGFLIALTYGRDVDWVKNVVTEGGCRLIHRGRGVDLIDPRILPLQEVTGSIPGWIRSILRTLGVSEVLHLRARQDRPLSLAGPC